MQENDFDLWIETQCRRSDEKYLKETKKLM